MKALVGGTWPGLVNWIRHQFPSERIDGQWAHLCIEHVVEPYPGI